MQHHFQQTPENIFDTTSNISQFLPFEATSEQLAALVSIQKFIADDSDFLIVKGAAGTGKTTIMKAVACFLDSQKTSFKLLAPTGRAAKNIAQKTGYDASTIHSAIYDVDTDIENAVVRFTLSFNLNGHQVFIIDESSMIGDREMPQEGFQTQNTLMADLLTYIKQGSKSSKVIFVGDTCQLPPVGYGNNEQSPCLDTHYLINNYKLKGSFIELSKVMRQAEDSYILNAAYEVRNHIITPSKGRFTKEIGNFSGKPEQVANLYLNKYDANNHDAVAIISFSNKYVSNCNQLIRTGLGLTGLLCIGDRIVINQTFYRSDSSFITNGTVGVIKAIGAKQIVAELSFLNVEIEFTTNFNEKYSITTKIMLDTLIDPNAYTYEKKKALFAIAFQKNPIFRESKKVWDDVFLSAMQICYGHAFTCHKAQGSEWDTVLLNTWSPNNDYRFLYTGITRARKNLYTNGGHLINSISTPITISKKRTLFSV